LYIILFLHQTTTDCGSTSRTCWLYIILFLHQTTTMRPEMFIPLSCISSYSYIKPQRFRSGSSRKRVVYHPIPTSNHNHIGIVGIHHELYIILFLHQTTTCMILVLSIVVLYIILFLHQTTTLISCSTLHPLLYIILFLHQTTT